MNQDLRHPPRRTRDVAQSPAQQQAWPKGRPELSSVTWSGFEVKEHKPSQQNYFSKPFLSSN